MRILVTGANGFLGRALVGHLSQDVRIEVRAASRSAPAFPPQVRHYVAPSLSLQADWQVALDGVSVVVHAAARVHVMNDAADDPLAEFRKANVDGTVSLARQAAAAGVRRFIFISSIKVNGEGTEPEQPFRAGDTPDPQDPYGVSKVEAEQALRVVASETGMEVVIIRPVLVYGPGVKANFRSMMSWLSKGVPLPLGATGNKRSLVALDNLVDLIVTCIDHPAAANQTFLVSDGEDLSTTQLLQRMGNALGRPARLLPIPASMLYAAAAMLGRRAVAQRLCGSLQVDIAKTRELLGWTPPVSVDDALLRTARAFAAD